MDDFKPAGTVETRASTLEGDLLRLLHQDAARHELAGLLDQVRAMPDGPERSRLTQSIEYGVTIKERLEEHQLRERGLLALIETAQDLTAITDLDHVLNAIVQRARKLVGCDVGYLSIYDNERSDFYVRATDGAFSERFKKIRIGLEVGVCGFVARNRAPYSSSNYGADGRFVHTDFIDSAIRDEDIKSILGVPLLSGDQVIGVLFVGDRYVRTYIAWEMSILSTLAAHASVAIGNARLFKQAEQALKHASTTNALLVRQTADTRAAAEAHEQLTSLVAHGGDLTDLCHMVAKRLGGHVMVCDEGGIAVCASADSANILTFPPDAQGNKHWFEDKLHAALHESGRAGRSVTVFCEDAHVCVVCAVMGGKRLLGGLIIHTESVLNEVAVRIFERSAMVTGVVLLQKEQRSLSMLVNVPATLHGLISRPHGHIAVLSGQAAAYGLDLSLPMRAVLVQLDPGRAAYLAKKLRTIPGVAGALFGEVGDALLALINEDALDTLINGVNHCLSDYRGDYTGVISDSIPTFTGIPDAYQLLVQCAGLLNALERKNAIFEQSQLALYCSLLGTADRDAIDAFLSAMLGSLYRHGGDARAIELARTLLAYLDNGHNARAAARQLGVHINTLRQRLDTLDTLLSNWREAGKSLEIHIALRLWHLRDHQAFAARA